MNNQHQPIHIPLTGQSEKESISKPKEDLQEQTVRKCFGCETPIPELQFICYSCAVKLHSQKPVRQPMVTGVTRITSSGQI